MYAYIILFQTSDCISTLKPVINTMQPDLVVEVNFNKTK